LEKDKNVFEKRKVNTGLKLLIKEIAIQGQS